MGEKFQGLLESPNKMAAEMAEVAAERNQRGELERRRRWRARVAARATATVECWGKRRVRGK